MCGIAGYWGDFSPELLEGFNQAIAHRGPDGQGTYVADSHGVGLAHRRLSIIDLSPRGAQPMWDADEQACIIYNGELYNYREKKARLCSQGYRFESETDTEVVLNLYLREVARGGNGTGFLEQLNGIFAFAIWDPRRQRVLLARDQYGTKPLYLAETDRGVLFASEMKALLQSPAVDRSLDRQAVHQHMAYMWCPAPRTVLEGVRKVEPGQWVDLRGGEVRAKDYFYDLPYRAAKPRMSAERAIGRVRDGLRTSVRRQLVSDVPVGAFLSGGLDSSSIAALYRELAPDRPIDCFTIDFEATGDGGESEDSWDGFATDLPYAERVAEELDVDLSVVTVGPDMVSRLGEMLYALDEPQADLAPLNALFISELARDKGIKVLLSGAGGDDIFSGYRRHVALNIERLWAWMPRPARRAVGAAADRLPEGSATFRRLAKAFRYAGWEERERLISYFMWHPPGAIRQLYSDQMRAHIQPGDEMRPLLRSLDRLPDGIDPLDQMLYLEAKHFLADHNLNYTDKTGMAAGVEVRVPFLDPDLVRLATSLPARYKQRGLEGKWVLKKAMEPLLPEDVIWRPKTGFGVPLRQWLDGQLAPLKRELLSAETLRARGLFDPETVEQMIAADAAGRVDAAGATLQMMCLELWCRMFVDPDTPQPLDISVA